MSISNQLNYPKEPKLHDYMLKLANKIMDKLRPGCEAIMIAGSIRREMVMCGDIELVCIPKIGDVPVQNGLFEDIVQASMLDHILKSCELKATLKDGNRYKQMVLMDGTYLDLFITNEKDWGRQVAIRTGSSKYSMTLAKKWVEKGYRGTDQGLVDERDVTKHGENVYKVSSQFPRFAPPFPTELSFFEWLGIPMPEPRKRNLS